MPVDKPGGGGEGRLHGVPSLIHYMLAFALYGAPVMILVCIVLAIEWGVGARLIYEGFKWAWQLFNF